MILTEWCTQTAWEYGVDPVLRFSVECDRDIEGSVWSVCFTLDLVHANETERIVPSQIVPLAKGVNSVTIPCEFWSYIPRHPWTLLQSASLLTITCSPSAVMGSIPSSTTKQISCLVRFLPRGDSVVMLVEAPTAPGTPLPFDSPFADAASA